MATYISLIRGINVGGHKKIKMEDLREAVEAQGFKRVRTYVQSGNIVFEAPKQAATAVSRKIETVIKKKFGHDAAVITKTPEDLQTVLAANPFLQEKAIDPAYLHVVFLAETPEASGIKRLETVSSGSDRYHWKNDILFLHLPNGAGNSKLAAAPFERWLGVQATARNWRTVSNLYQMTTERT